MKSLALALVAATTLAWASPASANNFYLYGNSEIVAGPAGSDGTVFQHTSNPLDPPAWGGQEVEITTPMVLNDLVHLSADYMMTVGTFGAGAPRFTLWDMDFDTAWIYWGTPLGGGAFSDPNPGVWANTGNLADAGSADVRVYSNGFGGVNSPNTGMTFAAFLALAGLEGISYIDLDLDGGFVAPGQQLLADHWTVNNEVFDAQADAAPVPEPATLMLFGVGLAGIATQVRRRSRRTAA